ncbi:hypothetical protein DFH06DRAFT_98599 [Mycena polygramma]|nr:hypothetical protein DFH06DRAFT_98599 [Mycena polygramma]
MPRPRLFYSSSNEWISSLVSVSRGLVSVGNCTPFPYVGTALSAGVALLELIQTVGKTTDDLKYLAESVVTIMKLLQPLPGLPQLFGFCDTLRFQSLVFHEDFKTLSEYGASLPSSRDIVDDTGFRLRGPSQLLDSTGTQTFLQSLPVCTSERSKWEINNNTCRNVARKRSTIISRSRQAILAMVRLFAQYLLPST